MNHDSHASVTRCAWRPGKVQGLLHSHIYWLWSRSRVGMLVSAAPETYHHTPVTQVLNYRLKRHQVLNLYLYINNAVQRHWYLGGLVGELQQEPRRPGARLRSVRRSRAAKPQPDVNEMQMLAQRVNIHLLQAHLPTLWDVGLCIIVWHSASPKYLLMSGSVGTNTKYLFLRYKANPFVTLHSSDIPR